MLEILKLMKVLITFPRNDTLHEPREAYNQKLKVCYLLFFYFFSFIFPQGESIEKMA